ncbi:MAG: hypothetical protein REI09_03840 [Candidatus Dactylopiibacterium sp.]|nr:hypothetical protein [Candidatus Dactylopiibacterium sp.]
MKGQRGFATLAALGVASLITATVVWQALSTRGGASFQQHETRAALRALREAREALIAHALIEDNTPGSLPSPSGEDVLDGRSTPLGFTGSPGQAARRLPWHFLALAPAQDCLWYALAHTHRNTLSTHLRRAGNGTAINAASAGPLRVHTPTADVAAVAVIIAPGRAGPAQGGRTAPGVARNCEGGSVPAFLEGRNADGSEDFDMPPLHGNDLVLALSAEDLLRPVLRRVLGRFRSESQRADLLAQIHLQPGDGTLDSLRCAATASGVPCAFAQHFDERLAGTEAARLVYGGQPCPGLSRVDGATYRHPVSWLCFNDWYAHIRYERASDRLVAQLPGAAGVCRLDLQSGRLHCEH